MNQRAFVLLAAILLGAPIPGHGQEPGKGADGKNAWPGWSLFGGSPARNMVNLVDKNVPTEWNVEDGKFQNVKWAVKLGSKSFSGPVVAGGKIFVGTNNAYPRDAKDLAKIKANPRDAVKIKNQTVLMCFNEADGKFLWQAVHPIPPINIFDDVRSLGLLSTPAVDGTKVYYVTTSAEVICADAAMGRPLWRYDMMKELNVQPFHCCNCSPLVVGDKVFLVTGNGVDNTGKIPSPKAPSFIALDKDKGTLVWQSNLPGDKIIEGQWSNPVYAEVEGKGQVIFPGGDSWLYALEPTTGNLIWKFNCVPHRPAQGISNYMIATPVVHENKLYIGLGVYPDHPHLTRFSHFLCVDVTKKGDVSPIDLDAKNPKNKDSALVWAFGGPINPRPAKGRLVYFGSTISTAAVHDGLAWIAEERGYLHCLDAKTGQRHWEHDLLADIWGSPFWVEGKIYLGSGDGEMVIFEHGKNKKELAKVSMEERIDGTPVVANGVLYVMTKSRLYAIAKGGTATAPK